MNIAELGLGAGTGLGGLMAPANPAVPGFANALQTALGAPGANVAGNAAAAIVVDPKLANGAAGAALVTPQLGADAALAAVPDQVTVPAKPADAMTTPLPGATPAEAVTPGKVAIQPGAQPVLPVNGAELPQGEAAPVVALPADNPDNIQPAVTVPAKPPVAGAQPQAPALPAQQVPQAQVQPVKAKPQQAEQKQVANNNAIVLPEQIVAQSGGIAIPLVTGKPVKAGATDPLLAEGGTGEDKPQDAAGQEVAAAVLVVPQLAEAVKPVPVQAAPNARQVQANPFEVAAATTINADKATDAPVSTDAQGGDFAGQMADAGGDVPGFAGQPVSHGASRSAAPGSVEGNGAPLPQNAQEPVVHARPGEVGRGMGVEIARRIGEGGDELRVRMNPEDLGRIDVSISFDDKGNLRATMRADSPKALELLRSEHADLNRALDQAGVRADSQSFRFESRTNDNSQGWRDQQQARQQQSNQRGGGMDAMPVSAQEIADHYRPLRSTGRVDLLA